MSTTTDRCKDIEDLTVYRLANEAEVTTPDSPTSPGSQFLDHVRGAFVEHVEYQDEGYHWDLDDAHEIADGAVPIYTHKKWQTFIDLAAYNEDVSELGGESADMDQQASIALYMIAERLCCRLAEMLESEGTEDDET